MDYQGIAMGEHGLKKRGNGWIRILNNIVKLEQNINMTQAMTRTKYITNSYIILLMYC